MSDLCSKGTCDQLMMHGLIEILLGKLVFLCINTTTIKTFAAQIAAHPQTVGALFSSHNDVTSYALCRSADAACDLRALCQSLNKALNGKGGGNQELCCGKLPDCTEEQLRQAILSFVQQ